MKPTRVFIHIACLLAFIFYALTFSAQAQQDPLPSWKDTASKKAVISFVNKVTKKGSPDFIPVAERIATFDNDGTLCAEKPLSTRMYFIINRIKALFAQHPEWKSLDPFTSVLNDNINNLLTNGEPVVGEIIMAAMTGMTTDEYDAIVKDWLSKARHPVTNRPFTEMVYQPMLELLTYMKANGFKNYIVTGGEIDLMREFSKQVYDIPPEQVLGNTFKLKYELRDGKPVLIRLPEINFIVNNDGKPVAIQQCIGLRPIAAIGNSDKDLPMVQWATSGKGLRLGMLIHHNDAEREWAYDRNSIIGKLDKGLDEAASNGWILVSMKDDWIKVFPKGSVAKTP